MGVVEIAGIIISLITTFGPKAMEVWESWISKVGDNPTIEQWNELKSKIASKNPDTY